MPEEVLAAGAAATATETAEPEVQPTETPEVETPEVRPAPEGVEPEAAEAEGAEAEFDAEESARIGSAKLRDALGKFGKADKAAARELKNVYFEREAILKEFPEARSAKDAIREIRTIKATLESIGGEPGIEEMQTEIGDWRDEAERFAAGEMSLINELGESNPEALGLAAANSLDWLAAHNGPAFDAAIVPALDARLEGAGFYSMLEALAENIQKGDGQTAWNNLQKTIEWAKTIRSNAGKQREGRQAMMNADPREAEFAEREERLAAHEKSLNEGSINSYLTPLNNRALVKLVDPLMRDMKVRPEGRRDFVNVLQQKIWAAMKADKVFQKRAKALIAQGNHQASAEFIHDKFNELLPSFFMRQRNYLYPSWRPRANNGKVPVSGARPAAPAAPGQKKPGAPAAPTSAIMIKEPLKGDDVDWKKTPQVLYIAGKAYGKNGKFYQWSVRH
jgi:hypothetical protein